MKYTLDVTPAVHYAETLRRAPDVVRSEIGAGIDEASSLLVREVKEETGIEAEVVGLLGVFDGLRRGFSRVPLYSLVFHCRAVGGELDPHPLECLDVGWFSRDQLPEPLASGAFWADVAFAAIDGEQRPTYYDVPRDEVWRLTPGS